ncbi:hypothetical protein AVEN_127919-1 [Araneus ventricosus]|uniref:Uncharacterized protein n=1 Tax=Araneus ventricosus TaxID=182803 RepID=A0A4Y1ZYT1_ARAVE|nr:hypothetical protein AVEN_127919-1 [Araneus ventricosus]
MGSLPHVRSNSPILDSHMSASRERDNACWSQSTAITNKELPILTLYRLKAVCLLIASIEYALTEKDGMQLDELSSDICNVTMTSGIPHQPTHPFGVKHASRTVDSIDTLVAYKNPQNSVCSINS